MSKNQTRSEIIKQRLQQMTPRAMERRDFMHDHVSGWNENWYIRVGGDGFRAVSLDDNHPLCGFSRDGAKRIETVRNHFKGQIMGEPIKHKPERRMQCWLIKQAFKNGLDLKTALCIDSVYDELLFALDEVSLGDRNNKPIQRCDILAVGVCQGKAYPVLIELKPAREKTRLIEQLDGFCEEMKKDFPDYFKKILTNCVDRDVTMNKIGKMIIWPAPKSNGKLTKKTLHDLKEKGIDVIEYKGDPDQHIDRVSYTPVSMQGPR